MPYMVGYMPYHSGLRTVLGGLRTVPPMVGLYAVLGPLYAVLSPLYAVVGFPVYRAPPLILPALRFPIRRVIVGYMPYPPCGFLSPF